MATITIQATQNFLKPSVISNVFKKYVSIPQGLPIIDIGAGTGNITQWLVTETKNDILAYELDLALAKSLSEAYRQYPRVQIQATNFLAAVNLPSRYCVVSNIPFMSTTAIVKQLTEDKRFEFGYFVMQEEAANRFGGQQLTAPSGILSIQMQIRHKFSLLHHFSRADFSPAPSVETVLVKIERIQNKVSLDQEQFFMNLVSYLFNQSHPVVRRAPILGRYMARRIDLGRIQLMQKKPSDLTFDDFLYLFSLCTYEVLEKIAGYDEKLKSEGSSVQKIYRTRNASNWKNMV